MTNKVLYKVRVNLNGEVKEFRKMAKSEDQALALALRDYEGRIGYVNKALWAKIKNNKDSYKVERMTPRRGE